MTIDTNTLEKNYNFNLNIFKQYIPHIYQRLATESNNEYCLELFENELNISKSGSLIYPKDRVNEHFNDMIEQKYILNYKLGVCKEDYSYKFLFKQTLHFKYTHLLYKEYLNIFKKDPILNEPKDDFAYAFAIFGIGLGYHIPHLLKKYDIKHLVLIDVDIEMLRASLYTINWKEILIYFSNQEKQRRLTFLIGNKEENFDTTLYNYLAHQNPMAYYNLSQNISYSETFFDEKIKKFQNNCSLISTDNKGFYDDEKMSLQHTLHAVNEKIPILAKTDYKVDKNKHVFIIANGPSLDKYIDVVKKYKNDVIIIAAGSALGSLYKYNIKPDILVQVERHMITVEATLQYASKEFLKDITLICVNSIHPRLFSLFNKKYIFCKYNDTGTTVLHDNTEQKFPALYNSTPTVSNAAFVIASYLGFKNFSLFGMDFGYKSTKDHHSKNSIYYDKKTMFYGKSHHGEIEVPGIDGGSVFTETMYNDSRKNLELAISIAKDLEEIKVYNYSHGALIKHVTKTNPDNKYLLNISNSISNEETLKVIDKQFVKYNNKIQIDYDTICNSFDELINQLKSINTIDMDTRSFLKIHDEFQDMFQVLFKEHLFVQKLLKGSLTIMFAYIYSFLSPHPHSSNSSLFIKTSLNLLIDFFKDIKKDIRDIEKTIDIVRRPKK